MLSRNQKTEIIQKLRKDIESSKAIFLTNLVGISANDAVRIRREVRGVEGKVVIARNTLFQQAAKGTPCESVLKNLKGTNAVVFAFNDAAAVASVLGKANADLELVALNGGLLGDKVLSMTDVKILSKLPPRDQMLATLLATMQAPISAFVRLLESIRAQKEKGDAVA